MYIVWEALVFFELLTTSCWLKCGCDYCSLGSTVDWRWWNHKIEGARVPALWNAMPALDCPLLDFFCMREKNISILFPSLLVWISSLATFQSLVATVQLNTYNYDPIYVKKKRRNLYMCTRWMILTLAQKPQGNLLQHWRHIIILHNKPRGGAASGLANWVAGLHHQGLRDFPSFSFAIFWLDPVIIARWWLQFQATRSYISITRRQGTPFLLQLFFCLFACFSSLFQKQRNFFLEPSSQPSLTFHWS